MIMTYITSQQTGEQKIPSKATWNTLTLTELYKIESDLIDIINSIGNPNVSKAYQIHLMSLQNLIKAKEFQNSLPSSDE